MEVTQAMRDKVASSYAHAVMSRDALQQNPPNIQLAYQEITYAAQDANAAYVLMSPPPPPIGNPTR